MQYCKWCYFIMEDFNRIIDDFTGWYGVDQVAFLKVDGQIIWELAQRYQIMKFPAFIAIAPKSAEAKSVFKNPQRNYETLKMWLSEVIGDQLTLITNDTHVLEEMDTKSFSKLWEEIQSIMSDRQIRDSDT